jgi:peroxiredoxin
MELLRARRAEFEAVGVRPFGISRDSPWTHISWAQALDLDFGLLSDWNGDATRGFGVDFEYRGLRDVSARSAFLIGADGVVRAAWEYETTELPDFDAILAAVRESM